MYIDCESVYSSSSAVKQTNETLQKKFNPVPFFSLLASFIVVIIVSKSLTVSWRKTQTSVNRSDLLTINNPQRLRFLTALNTSSWKVFWSKSDSNHFENSPSFKISWTYSYVFQINEKLIHNCPNLVPGAFSSTIFKMADPPFWKSSRRRPWGRGLPRWQRWRAK